jgi:hypothetical protein
MSQFVVVEAIALLMLAGCAVYWLANHVLKITREIAATHREMVASVSAIVKENSELRLSAVTRPAALPPVSTVPVTPQEERRRETARQAVSNLSLEEKRVLLAALDSAAENIREKELEILFDKETVGSAITKCSRTGLILNDPRGFRAVRPALQDALVFVLESELLSETLNVASDTPFLVHG